MSLTLTHLRSVLEGGCPGLLATCAPDGEPNATYLSDVFYVDPAHLALSFQFFGKTRRNVLANPYARLIVLHPSTARQWRVLAHYVRTETSGPTFERMRARLAGIAAAHQQADVFRLQGSDIYRVLEIAPVPGIAPEYRPAKELLPALAHTCDALSQASSLSEATDRLMTALADRFDLPHAMLMLLDPSLQRLSTVASQGYPQAGTGAEVPLGRGLAGRCAQAGIALRINHAQADEAYARAVHGPSDDDESGRIALPGLAQPGSQMALPVRVGGRLAGVLVLEHPEPMRFDYDLEDALGIVLGVYAQLLARHDLRSLAPPVRGAVPAAADGPVLAVRRVPRHNAVFVNDEYVIRGVAGAVLWKMLTEHARHGRSEFSSRELRADPALPLPELSDNLSVRLILLQRRLAERPCGLTLERSARGRVRLGVAGRLLLADGA